MKLLKSLFAYYKSVFLWSFSINILILIGSQDFVHIIFTKLFLVIMFWLLLKDARVRKKIGFYKMVGFSNLKLLSLLFLMDCTTSFIFIFLLKGFVWLQQNKRQATAPFSKTKKGKLFPISLFKLLFFNYTIRI